MTNINPKVLVVLRGVGLVILMSVLSYFADATHLNGLVNPVMAGLVAGIAGLIENSVQKNYGRALFGLVHA